MNISDIFMTCDCNNRLLDGQEITLTSLSFFFSIQGVVFKCYDYLLATE